MLLRLLDGRKWIGAVIHNPFIQGCLGQGILGQGDPGLSDAQGDRVYRVPERQVAGGQEQGEGSQWQNNGCQPAPSKSGVGTIYHFILPFIHPGH